MTSSRDKSRYEVVVGNVGTVYTGTSRKDALDSYNEYVELSESGFGRAANEDVALMLDGEFEQEHLGEKPEEESFEDEGPTEGDLTTDDHIHFYEHEGLKGGPVLTIQAQPAPFEPAEDASEPVGDASMWKQLDAYMKSQKFFPNVWFISDHGNAHLMSRPKKKSRRRSKR